MRLWLLLVCAACGNDREGRANKPPPVGPGDVARQSIDVTTIGNAPVKVRGVEIDATRPRGELDITYRVEATGPALVPARTMCRVGERNLVYPMSTSGKVAGPRLSGVFRAEPFSETASACETLFMYAPSDAGAATKFAVAGRACFEAGKLRDGACGEASFPPPQLPTAGAIVLERAAIEMHDDTATVTALYTITQPVGEDRKLAATLVCAQDKISTETSLTFLPLDEIPVGASVFGPLTFVLDRTPGPDAQCTVSIVSRVVGDAPGNERTLAQYCLTTRSVAVGRC